MLVSVVIPAWNEERRIARAVAAVADELVRVGLDFEIVGVDDGSTDATAAVLARCARDPRVRIARLAKHAGKGAAVREGVLSARGDFVFFIDADLSTPPSAIAAALALLQSGADVVRGSRHCAGARVVRRQGLPRRLLGHWFLVVARAIADPAASDLTCGFKGYRRAAALTIFGQCRLTGWAFDAETALIARRIGFVTRELPVEWTDDPDSRVRLPAAMLQSATGLLRLMVRDLRGRVLHPRPRQA